jgi:hypothetical protein
MKMLCLLMLLLATTALHAQQAGVDCVPIQGQGWSGCDPNYQPQSQQPQAPQLPPLIWTDHYGAIATDPIKSILGTAIDQTSQSQAEQAAFADCKAKGGTACKQDIWYVNQCVAMVVGETGYNTKAGATIADAVQAAMKVCSAATGNCHAYYTACSLPQRIQ